MQNDLLIDGIASLSDRFEGFIIDQWGVLHDGTNAYDGVHDVLGELQRRNKRILLLSNSGRRSSTNRQSLKAMGFNPDGLDGVITSGEATWRAIQRREEPPFDRLGKRCWLLTRDEDQGPVDGLGLEIVDEPTEADFLYLTFFQGRDRDTEALRERLRPAADKGIPLICANPDKVAVSPEGLLEAPGKVAADYQEMGGEAVFVGKPHRPIYSACFEVLDGLEPTEIVALGDSVEHDIAGARSAGLTSVLVMTGIHKELFDEEGRERALDMLAERHGVRPDHLLDRLRW